MGKYEGNPDWADITPIWLDHGGPNPLAAIAYKEEYSEAMAYLRAVMAKNEFSERVLGLTEDIILMNPAHYTVWLYRAKVITAINYPLRDEIAFLNPTALKHQKNYQIWHHRQLIVSQLDSPSGETDFIAQMFEKDAKNYHVWSYRQWLVQRFQLWDKGEVEDVEEILRRDVRNNSAWNHRWFVVFGRDDRGNVFEDREVVEREIRYAKDAIYKAPQNQSPWNYLKAIIKNTKQPLSTLKPFVEEFAKVETPDDIRSSHALDILAEILAENEGEKEKAAEALELLAKKYDPIRANYWRWRKSLLDKPKPEPSVASVEKGVQEVTV